MKNKYKHRYYQPLFPTLIVLFILLIAYSLSLNATIRYVSHSGSNTYPYTSWSTAADSIMTAVNVCVFGDTIYVANGVYEEQVVMIPGLSLIGAGMDSCVVDARPLYVLYAITLADSCLLKGFKIFATNTTNMRCVNVSANNSIVTLNHITTASEGIYSSNSNSIIYKNVFNNIRTRGISIYNANCLIVKNYIYINSTNPSKGIFIQANTSNYRPIIDSNYIETNNDGIDKNIGTMSTIKNNEIRLVGASDGIYLYSPFSDSNWVFSNLIIAEFASSGIYTNGSNHLEIHNNYITGNYFAYALSVGPNHTVKNNVITNSEKGVEVWGTQNLDFKYNNVWNNDINYSGFTPDTTNLSVDPMIVNDDSTKGDLDFHLQMFSPLIDAGDPTILDKDSTRSDIGLYGGPYGESYIYVDLPPRIPVNLTVIVDSLIKLKWNRNTEADFSYYNVYRDTTFDFTVDSTKLIASVTDTFYYHKFPSNAETLYYKLTAVDNQNNESNPSEQVIVKVVGIRNEWVPVNNYMLYQNYPNPFNPSTKIGYKLRERGYVKLYVYDIKGELVSVLVNQTQEAGYYEVGFSVGQESIPVLSSGVYIYQMMVTGENNILVFSDIKKMIFIK